MNWPFLLFLNKIVIFYQIYLIFFLDKTHKLFLGTDQKCSQKWRIMALELKLKVIIECVYIWAYLKDLRFISKTKIIQIDLWSFKEYRFVVLFPRVQFLQKLGPNFLNFCYKSHSHLLRGITRWIVPFFI